VETDPGAQACAAMPVRDLTSLQPDQAAFPIDASGPLR
jgi:hypothetical protein